MSTVPKSASKKAVAAATAVATAGSKQKEIREGGGGGASSKEKNLAGVTIRKSKSTVSHALALRLRRHLDSTASSTRRVFRTNNNSKSGSANGSSNRTTDIKVGADSHEERKGCQIRISSGFKAVIYLVLIVGVTAAVGAWLYFNKFGPDARRGRGAASGPWEEGEEKVTFDDEGEVDLYLDFQGNIHSVSEITVGVGVGVGVDGDRGNGKKREFPASFNGAGGRGGGVKGEKKK